MSIGGLILLSLALGVGAWLFFLWTVKSGQYEDPEGPKYRMLDDDDASPGASPDRENRAADHGPPRGPGPRP